MKADPKLVKLLEALIELREKEDLVLEELLVLAGGGVGIGEKMKLGYRYFAEAWGLAHPGEAYVWNYTKDAPNMKRLLKSLTPDEIGNRAARYVANNEDFIVRARHSFPMFVATINQHVDPNRQSDGATSCKHSPRCKDDAACTKRTTREVLHGNA